MLRCLEFMQTEYREGRPAIAPHRKDHEQITGEDMQWQLADAVRDEYDDDATELRLAQELKEYTWTIGEADDPWEEHYSDEHRLAYYWNSRTGETLWEKPITPQTSGC